MSDLHSLPLAQLEALCDQTMLEFYRRLHGNKPGQYRDAIVHFLTRPRLPTDEVFAAIRTNPVPTDAWREVLSACRLSAVGAPWDELPDVDIDADIEEARDWLTDQLPRLTGVSGVYLGLDTLNMDGGAGTNVDIGGTEECDPASDSMDWLESELNRGDGHLIRGLYELHAGYTGPAWQVMDERVAQGNYFGFADYMLTLGYSGIVLAHAFDNLPVDRSLLAGWGFHDGDMFLLGRTTPDGFVRVCR